MRGKAGGGVEDVHGGLVDGTEFGAVIKFKVKVGYHGLAQQKIDGCQFHDVVLLDGKLVRGSEEQDRVVSRRLREFDGGRRGWGGCGIGGSRGWRNGGIDDLLGVFYSGLSHR